MAAAPKFDTDHPLQGEMSPEEQTYVREAADETTSPYASPAKELQARLSNELTYSGDKYSPRAVTTLIVMFCASTWVGAYMLYNVF